MTAKISACLIVRDEQGTLEACLASIRPYVDEICIVDTGSTDDTPAIARKFADKFEVFLDCNDDEQRIDDFSLARNRSFAIATNDVVLWVDGDDVVQGAENLPKLAADLVKHENGQIVLPYEYSHDDAGRVTLLQYRERLLYPRKQWEWRFPIHESCLLAAGNQLDFVAREESVRFVHRSSTAKTREVDRNLRILRKYIGRVGEDDVRSLYYYGVELGLQAMRGYGRGDTGAFLEHTGASLRVLKRYVELAYWADEKYLALLEIARHYQRLNDHGEAIRWAFRASETKHFPEPYWVLMKSFYALGRQDKRTERLNYEKAVHFGQIGMSLAPTDVAQSLLAQNPTERFEAYEILAICQGSIGLLDSAITSLETGLQMLPEHERMQSNLKSYRVERSKRRVMAETAELVTAGALDAGADTIIKGALRGDFEVRLLSAATDMPDAAAGRALPARGDDAGASRGGHIDPRPARDPGKLDIIFYVGEGYEPWNGETIARTGLGGSETMAWELARRLAGRGHSVRIVGHCGPAAPAGEFAGVTFVDWRDFFHAYYGRGHGGRNCDVLISSRRPEVVDDAASIEAKLRVLWIHDVHCGAALTHKRNIRFDRILALTNWHKSFLRRCYPLIDPDKILVTRNGIDLKRYEGKETRNARRAIYSSSPDRGLDVLLDVWPVVRKSIPDAELHVFYGFENWERSADDNERKKIQHLRAKLRRTAGVLPGYGRVNGVELARAQLRSGVWAYPTAFQETSCAHPDTRISVPGDHRGGAPTVRLGDMVGKSGFPVYAFNEEENRFEIATCLRVWETRIAPELVAIELDSGGTLRLTPEHKVLTFDGEWVEAGSLKAGDSLRALHYRYNVAIRDANGRWTDEHRLVGAWQEGRKLRPDEHVDHTDLERLDNRPEMLTVMSAADHFRKTHKGRKQSKKFSSRASARLAEYRNSLTPEELSERTSLAGHAAWNSIKAKSPEEYAAWSSARIAKRRATISERMLNPEYAATARELLLAKGARGRASRQSWEQANPELAAERNSRIAKTANDARWGKNHKVLSITRITGGPVFDMEVERLHNFVADGVVIHNCITAMEAQAAGCRIVTSPLAALNETVGARGQLIAGFGTPGYTDTFAAAVVVAMQESLGQRAVDDRAALQSYAREHFGLDELASEWETIMIDSLADVQKRIVPAFHKVSVA